MEEEARLAEQRKKEEEERVKQAEFAALSSEAQQIIKNKEEAERKKNEGNDFYKKRKFPEAIERYNQACCLDPTELTYYTNLAACYFELAEYDKCIEQCDVAIKTGRETGGYDYVKMGKAIARKANALFKQGKLDESIEAYDEAMLEDRSYTIKEAKKKVEKFKKEQEEKAYINPKIAEQHKAKGNEFFSAGDFVSAKREFDEGLRRDPQNKFLYSNRCACYLKLMDPVSAQRDAEKAIQIDPTFVKGWARKGTCHQMQKEYHKALDAF